MPDCNKKTYESRKVAKTKMKQLNKNQGFNINGFYFCLQCNGWHHTTMTMEQVRSYQKNVIKQ